MPNHVIEPAARIITAIGKDLIKDIPASIVELVKNSYDADASFVKIIFSKINNELVVEIKDDGHGMDQETIINAWLVPGTNFKLKKKRSPKKRLYQGRKGLGRYAAAVLGNVLELESIKNGEKTVAKIDWNEFEKKQYLKDVKISLHTDTTDLSEGTTLLIKGGKEYIDLLTEKEVEDIQKELRKLISPLSNKVDDEFNIYIEFKNFYKEEYKNIQAKIEPFPILEMYNYRLSGTIDSSGKALMTYENAYENPVELVEIKKQLILEDTQYYCGNIRFDFRVYDKDDQGINSLIDKFESSSPEETIGIRFVKNLLKDSVGVGIYRNGFRIRPHGDPGFDWLNLDNRRVQNPSQRIGSDQTAGFIMIEPEELSSLKEKSARDGLQESRYYEGLKAMMKDVLNELEKRRVIFRKQKNQNNNTSSSKDQIESLFDLTKFNKDVHNTLNEGLNKIKLNPEQVEEYTEEIKQNFEIKIQTLEKQKIKEYEKIKEIIAIYQGQATLGKIITVILHEGRKSLGWFSNQLPRTIKWLKKLKQEEKINNPLYEKILDRLQTTNTESKALTKLFNKLDPLTTTRRSNSKNIDIKDIITHVQEIFENELKSSNINFTLETEGDTLVTGVKEDFLMCMTNLIENSIYWLKKEPNLNRTITVTVIEEDNHLSIDIVDNGPGIEQEYIEKESIFIPGFSGKSEDSGTGLGLAIAGEAIMRNNGQLKAIYRTKGAHFRIELKK